MCRVVIPFHGYLRRNQYPPPLYSWEADEGAVHFIVKTMVAIAKSCEETALAT